MLQHVKGVWIALTLWSCTVLGSAVIMMPPLLFVYPFSEWLYNKILLSYAGLWFTWVATFFEFVNGTELVFTGDHIPHQETAFITCNHPSEVDWLWFFNIAARKGMAGRARIVIKKMMMYIPGLGWAMDCARFVFLSRNWELDKHQIEHSISTFTAPTGYDFWLFIFPEGTDFAPRKLEKSHRYADKHSLPKYRNVLLPRIKGFLKCLDSCENHVKAVYDITIGYEHGYENRPNVWSCVTGDRPQKVHVHVRRFLISSIPKSESDRVAFLFDLWREKDALLEQFKAKKRFVQPKSRKPPPRWQWPLSPLMTGLNFAFWNFFTFVCIYLTINYRWFMCWEIFSAVVFMASYNPAVRRFRGLDPTIPEKID